MHHQTRRVIQMIQPCDPIDHCPRQTMTEPIVHNASTETYHHLTWAQAQPLSPADPPPYLSARLPKQKNSKQSLTAIREPGQARKLSTGGEMAPHTLPCTGPPSSAHHTKLLQNSHSCCDIAATSPGASHGAVVVQWVTRYHVQHFTYK